MPNGNTHKTAGGWGGVFTYLIIQSKSDVKENIDPGGILLSAIVGAGTSRIPDILEPPINPNHRAFFHSLVFGGITVYVGVQAWNDLQKRRSERITAGNQQWSFNEFVDIALIVTSGSVLLHLIMDGFTKKGLNIV
jgi:membrane-bound metal-dependent hydrolase YbcI (DUF457 family)